MAASLATGIAGLLGLLGEGESWKDRLAEAAYTSPSGTRIKFSYGALTREFDKRTTAFDFAGVDNSYVQENGYGSRRYPMRCIFTGSNCDRIATAFEAALLESGVGKLEHPLYGTIDVVPFGTVTRRDDPIAEGNVSVVEVTFWTTTGAIYPRSQSHPQSEILAALDGFDVAAAQQFADAMDLASAVSKASAKASLKKFLRDVSAALEAASDKVAAVRRQFTDIQSQINFGMDVLIGQPLLLAQQVVNLVRAPGRALSGLTDRLDSYANLADRILASALGAPGDTLASGSEFAARTTKIANDFHLADLIASSAVAGAIGAIVADPVDDSGPVQGAQVASRADALATADALLTMYDAVNAWRESGFDALGEQEQLGAYQLDTGSTYRALQAATALTAGYLLQVSFSLAPERAVELDRESTIVNMAAELYGDVDEQLDFLINTNELTGTEILELPRGRRLVYYST